MVNASLAASSQDRQIAAHRAVPAQQDEPRVSFHDVIAVLNPLQYLPVVGTIYRAITGDEVHPAFRVAASAGMALLFGGPAGLAATMIAVAVEEVARGGPTSAGSGQSAAVASLAYSRAGRAA
jgi:hypothetical protein